MHGAGEEYSQDPTAATPTPSTASTGATPSSPTPIATVTAAARSTKPFKGAQIVAHYSLQTLEDMNSTARSTTTSSNQTSSSSSIRPQSTVKAGQGQAVSNAGSSTGTLLVLGAVAGVVGLML